MKPLRSALLPFLSDIRENSQKILINIVEERRQKLFETPGNNAKRGKMQVH